MPKKLLIIDDEPDLLTITVARVKKAGFAVIQATDGRSGLGMMHSEKPDLVLLDLLMPGMDGFEVCRCKNGDDAIRNIPVILFTGSLASVPIEETARELGADGHITKPFDSKELIEKIKNVLRE